MTDPSNVSTFTQIASVQCSRTGAWEQFEVPLYNYRGAGSYIAIMSPNGTASNPYLDDLTVTAAASIPYACNFESNGTNGWELVNGTQTNAWYVGSSVTVDSTTSPDPAAGYCGSKSLYISYNSGSSNYYSLNSTSYTYAKRTIKIEEDGNYIVNFDWKCPGWNSYNSYIRAFIIPVSQDNLVAGFAPNGGRAYSFANWNEPSGWKDLSGKSQAPYTLTGESNWQNHKDTVTLYAGIYNLVFTWANDSDSIYTTSPAAAIDNVSITAQPCPDISNLEATATSTEVTLTWNDGGIHSSWTINCAGRTHHTTDTFYTITGLIPNTEYYAHVYPDCRVNDSNYLSYIRFYTACTSISEQDLPYTENFDSYTSSTTTLTNVEPSCWTLAHQDVAMTDEYKPMIYYSADAHSGWYSLLLNKRCIYAMPKYEGDVSTLRLSMNVRQGNLNNQLIVGVMSDLDNDSTFDPVTTIDNTSTNSEFVIIDFNSYSGNGQYIAFRNTNSNANSEWGINFIDDITLELLPITPITEDTCSIKIADLPYSDNFDSYTTSTSAKTGVEPTCWTLAHKYVTMTPEYEPMVYYGNASAHSGSYSLLLNKRGIYAMPQFEGDVNTLQMSLYVRQSNVTYQLEVGVMSDLDDESTFIPVATLNNATTSEVTQYTVDFSSYTGAGKYIAFRNTNTVSSNVWGCNYIDDIVLSLIPDEPEPTCGIHISDLPYSENFDSYTESTTAKTDVEPTCWTLAHMDVSMTDAYKPMIYYSSANANSNSYSLILNKRGIYAMPEFEGDVRTLQMSMYVKQGELYYQLQVGVMSDLSDASTFVPVTTIDNESTDLEFVTIDFSSYSGNGKYIAFRNTNEQASSSWGCNYIDDITIDLASKQSHDGDVYSERHEVSVYPNPTSGMLTIVADDVKTVEVFDFAGRMVASYESTTAIDLSSLASGIYALRITTEYGTEIRKVVKQ